MIEPRIRVSVIAGLFGLASWQCGPETTGVADGLIVDTTGSGKSESTYLYTGYDSTRREIIRGELVLAVGDSGVVTGTWDLDEVGTAPPMIGPQVGQGRLVGQVGAAGFSANLNPQMVDNNVILMGAVVTDSITGRWEYIGFPGVLNRGSFTAVRNP